MKATSKPAKAAASAKGSKVFSDDERQAMREYAAEAKSARGGAASKVDGEAEVLAKIAAMNDADRAMAERIHAIVKAHAPDLKPRTWYGMPAYARGDKVVCFFQSGQKFKTRYATLGFSASAKLDDGNMWPSAFALLKLTPADEARIGALIKQAAN